MWIAHASLSLAAGGRRGQGRALVPRAGRAPACRRWPSVSREQPQWADPSWALPWAGRGPGRRAVPPGCDLGPYSGRGGCRPGGGSRPWVLDAGTSPLKAGPCWALQAGRVGAAATVRPGRPLLSPRRPCSQKPSTLTWHRLWLQTELKPLVLSVFAREEWCNRAPVRKRGHRAAPRHSPLGLLRYATGPSGRLLCPIHRTPRVTPRGQGCGRLLATGCSDGRLPGARQAP